MDRSVVLGFVIAVFLVSAVPGPDMLFIVANAAVGLAFVPQFITTGPGSWPATAQFLVLGGIFITVGFPVDATAGLLAGSLTERFFRAGSSVRRRLSASPPASSPLSPPASPPTSTEVRQPGPACRGSCRRPADRGRCRRRTAAVRR